MHEYDITLKNVIKGLTAPAFRLVTGAEEVVHWPNVELPEVRSPRVDMLGETADRFLVHIELQSTNDPDMPLRMLEYATGIRRAHGRFPSQVVLYAGRLPLRMPDRLAEPHVTFRYRLVDLRELDSEPLLASPHLEDNVIAVLTRLADQRAAIRRILRRIAASEPEFRGLAMKELEILAGLRELGPVITQEVTGMPILDDIMDHAVLGPKIREGIAIGMERGFERERQIVRRQIEKRFGPIPDWAERRLAAMSVTEIESAALRLLDAANLKEIFG